MLHRPLQLSQNSKQTENTSLDITLGGSAQDGLQHRNLLLDVPVEILTRITSNLLPHALFALSLVCGTLNAHVQDDNTWRHAFLAQYLGVGPEGDAEDSAKHIMLRREQASWKKEYIYRGELIRRWGTSPFGNVAHCPLGAQIDNMHLLDKDSLLCSSTHYGIVSRSLPLTGKVLNGHLDSTGATRARERVVSNVSATAVGGEGGTARVVWGYRSGSVAFMTTTRTMDAARHPIADFKVSELADQHTAAVTDVIVIGGWVVFTASEDGRIKMWDHTTGELFWSSEPTLHGARHAHEPCMRVVSTDKAHSVATVYKNGGIGIWTGFNWKNSRMAFEDGFTATAPCPSSIETAEVTSLHLEDMSVLLAYRNDPLFYRVEFAPDLSSHTVTSFGEPGFGAISTLTPYLSKAAPGLVIAGDTLGCVSVYKWDEPGAPFIRFDAFRDGASVTSLTWNGVLLVAGSSRGDTHIFDGISFTRLKKIKSPVPPFPLRAAHANPSPDKDVVHHILLSADRGTVVLGVGDRVLAWKPVHMPTASKGGVRGRKAAGTPIKAKVHNAHHAKWSRQSEVNHRIKETKGLMEEEEKEEAKRSQAIRGTLDRQRVKLDKMGLSESEALEYVLMMSRDEARPRTPPPGASSANAGDALTEEEFAAALQGGMFESALSSGADVGRSALPAIVTSGSDFARTAAFDDDEQFPSVRSSGSSDSSGSPRRTPSRPINSAWTTPLRSKAESGRASAPSQSNQSGQGGGAFDDMDDDLRFALELSLAEAQSRGEDA